jgi:hypothetical protein
VELFNEGEKLEEGVHYQCIFYGGALLAHYSTSADSGEDDFIQMLRINRHSVVVMDSDKAKNDAALKPRVERVIREAEKNEATIAWVTTGREIENYIPDSILSSHFQRKFQLEQFKNLSEEYKKMKEVENFDKVSFARKIVTAPEYTKEALSSQLDLKEQMQKVLEYIRIANTKITS